MARMGRALWGYWVAALVALAAIGCEETKPPEAAADPEPPPQKPKTALGGKCASNEDCDDGLGCAKDSTCQTYKTIECRGREDACEREGRCSGSDRGCVATTAADCKQSKLCKNDGRCTPKDGSCVVASAEDCAALCKQDGRCTVEADKCVAASADDCKQSEVCKQYDRCHVKNGICIEKT
jgi:hypothetical protein